MDMSAAATLLGPNAARNGDGSERIADLPVMLAVLSVKQAAGFTATRMREESPDDAGDQPGRMAVIFAPPSARPSLPNGLSGAFNAAVAERLSDGGDSERHIYSGT